MQETECRGGVHLPVRTPFRAPPEKGARVLKSLHSRSECDQRRRQWRKPAGTPAQLDIAAFGIKAKGEYLNKSRHRPTKNTLAAQLRQRSHPLRSAAVSACGWQGGAKICFRTQLAGQRNCLANDAQPNI